MFYKQGKAKTKTKTYTSKYYYYYIKMLPNIFASVAKHVSISILSTTYSKRALIGGHDVELQQVLQQVSCCTYGQLKAGWSD